MAGVRRGEDAIGIKGGRRRGGARRATPAVRVGTAVEAEGARKAGRRAPPSPTRSVRRAPAGRAVLSTRPGMGPRPAGAAPVPFGRVPHEWPLVPPRAPAGAAGLSVRPDGAIDPLPTDPVAAERAAEGRRMAAQRTGDGRWGDTAVPDGVTRAARGLGPMGVVRWWDRLRRVLSRRGSPGISPRSGSAHTIAMTCTTASSPYYCQSCQKQFSVKTNSLMHNSPLPYRKWLWAVYLHMTSLKGVSSMKLHRDIKVTQKTAWFMLQRIREAFRPLDLLPPMRGPVEVDETHVGGKRRNKSNAERRAATGRGFVDMTTVVGAKDRETNAVRAEVIATPTGRP